MRRVASPVVAAVIALAFLLAALAQAQHRRAPQELRETHYVFGTLVELVVIDAPGPAQVALAEVGGLLRDLHKAWHAWRPGALTTLNAALASGRPQQVSPRLVQVLTEGQVLACESAGMFDPAVGALIGLWGFHADTPPTGARPSDAAVDALIAQAPRMADLRFEGTRISSTNPAVQLDLGGYAKGAALDLAVQHLRNRGIETAVLNAGGDVHVLGQPTGRAWRVAIRDPFVWGAVAAVALASGEGLYTSGNYERFFEQDGQRFAHILDPRTGRPIQEIVSASVIHPNGARADAAATALSVAGAQSWAQVAADMGVTQALLITQEGRLLATPEMAARLDWTDPRFATRLEITPLPAPRRAFCARAPSTQLSALEQP